MSDEAEPGPVADRRRSVRARVRWLSSTRDASRERRPTDVLLLAVGLLALLLVYLVAPLPRRWDLLADLTLSALGTWLWTILLGVMGAWAVVLVVVSAALRHWPLLRVQLVSAVVAVGLGLVLPQVTPSGAAVDGVAHPAVQLALATALVTTTSPYVVVPIRHVGRWLVLLGLLATAATDTGGLAAALAALALGWAVGSAAHLALGSPGGRLTSAEVLQALAAIGVDARDLKESRLDDRGVAVMRGTAADGAPLLVKVYGRDAWDAQLMGSVWSGLWYRRRIPTTRPNRLAQVEHEAFATLLAERAGVAVLPVVAAGMADDRDALLVVEARGTPVSEEPGDRDDATLLAGYWRALARLHEIGLSHGAVTPERLVVRPDGTAALADLGAARTAPEPDDVLVDRAQLLVSTALISGPEQAVAVAAATIGTEALGDTVPMLQLAAVDPALRRAIRTREWDMRDLRERTVAASGREAPELARLRRVTPMSVLGLVVVVLLAYVLVNTLTGIGWAAMFEQLRHADGRWVLAAILLAPLMQVGSTFSTIGAAPRRVRFGPVLALQYAIQFTGLAVPTVAARVAVAMRFFQRAGLGPTAAVAVGAIDGFSGFVVQAILLVIIAVAGLSSLTVPPLLSDFDPSWALIAVVALAVVAIAMAIPPVRKVVLARLADLRGSLRILRSPRNVALLLGGNLVAQLLGAGVLAISVAAMGQRVPYPELVLILTLVSLFAGLMPVPGGIGITEAALSFGLVAAGLPEAAALSAAIVYRLATYYLPPAYGAVAMWWLRTRAYI